MNWLLIRGLCVAGITAIWSWQILPARAWEGGLQKSSGTPKNAERGNNDAQTNLAVAKLIEILKDTKQDAVVRADAAESLAEFGPKAKEAAPALVEALGECWIVREQARVALEKIGPGAIQALANSMRDENDLVREGALAVLRKLGRAAKEGVPVIRKALAADDEDIRTDAIRALEAIGDASCVPPLIDTLKADEEIWLRSRAAYALGQIGLAAKEAVPALIEAHRLGLKVARDGRERPGNPRLMPTPGFDLCRSATRALKAIGAGAVPALIRVMENDDERRWAIYVLGDIGAPAKDAVPAIAGALKHQDDLVREDAAFVLGKMGPSARLALPALSKGLKDSSTEVRMLAALSMHQIEPGNKEVLPALVKVLHDPDEEMRSRAAWRIGELGEGGKPALPALLAALKDDSPDVRASVLGGLTRIDPSAKSVIQALAASLKDRDSGVRRTAASNLKEVKQATSVIPALVGALSDKNEYTREHVVDALGIHGRKSPTAVSALLKALKDKNSRVRRSAALALGKIGPLNESVVPALAHGLCDPDEWVEQGAAFALEEIGPAAKAAVRELIKALKSEKWIVRDAAAGALKKIDPEAAAKVGVR